MKKLSKTAVHITQRVDYPENGNKTAYYNDKFCGYSEHVIYKISNVHGGILISWNVHYFMIYHGRDIFKEIFLSEQTCEMTIVHLAHFGNLSM